VYNYERFTIVITRFEDLFCGVTDEPKKNTKANKTNKRNTAILALTSTLNRWQTYWASLKWKEFPDFVYLSITRKFSMEYHLHWWWLHHLWETRNNCHDDITDYLFQKRFTLSVSPYSINTVPSGDEKLRESNHREGYIAWIRTWPSKLRPVYITIVFGSCNNCLGILESRRTYFLRQCGRDLKIQ